MFKAVLATFIGLILSYTGTSQVTFEKGEIIKKSFASTTIKCGPELCMSENGFHILSSGLASDKKIVQYDLDAKMNPISETTVKLPKGRRIQQILSVDKGTFIVLYVESSKSFEICSYDLKSLTIGEKKLTISGNEYLGKSSLEISLINEDFTDFISFGISPEYDISNLFTKIVVVDKDLDKIEWSHVIETPHFEKDKSKSNPRVDEIYVNDKNSVVIRYVQSSYTGEKSDIRTDLYSFNGQDVQNLWSKTVERSKIYDEFQSLPFPFVNKSGQPEVYHLDFKTADGRIALVRSNETENVLNETELESSIESYENVDRLMVNGFIVPTDTDFSNGSFCFVVSELLKRTEKTERGLRSVLKHYVISFDLESGEIVADNIVSSGHIKGVWSKHNGRVIFSSSLDAMINGEIVHNDQNEIFDRFVRVSKYVEPGYTFHYILNGELYSLHSEYATGNMTSQVVKWVFE